MHAGNRDAEEPGPRAAQGTLRSSSISHRPARHQSAELHPPGLPQDRTRYPSPGPQGCPARGSGSQRPPGSRCTVEAVEAVEAGVSPPMPRPALGAAVLTRVAGGEHARNRPKGSPRRRDLIAQLAELRRTGVAVGRGIDRAIQVQHTAGRSRLVRPASGGLGSVLPEIEASSHGSVLPRRSVAHSASRRRQGRGCANLAGPLSDPTLCQCGPGDDMAQCVWLDGTTPSSTSMMCD